MITVIYDLEKKTFFQVNRSVCSPNDVRDFVLQMKVQSMMDGTSHQGTMLVAFDDKDYFSVFALDHQDEEKLTSELLDEIKEKSTLLV